MFNLIHSVYFEDGVSFKVDRRGTKEWWLNGKYHREDGPALEDPDGSTFWLENNYLHRWDGPAVERADGKKKWFIEGTQYTERQYCFHMRLEYRNCFQKAFDKIMELFKLTLIPSRRQDGKS